MAAHRYWRLYIQACNSGPSSDYPVVDTIAMFAATGANLCTNTANVFASSTQAYNGTGLAINAVAGQAGTWSTGGFAPQWWAYDFGAATPVDIVSVQATANAPPFFTNGPTTSAVQYSDDNVTWTTGWSGTFACTTTALTSTISSAAALPAQTISVSPTSVSAGALAQTITVTGAGVSLTANTFALAGGLGATIVSSVINSATSATLTINPGLLGFGAITLTASGGGSAGMTVIAPALGLLRLGIIGDSISQGVNGNPVQAMSDFLTTQGYTVSVTNRAIGGTTTQDWLPSGSTLPPAISAFLAAGVTIVQLILGTNDVRTPLNMTPAQHNANMKLIVAALVAAGLKVVIGKPSFVIPNAAPAAGAVWPNNVNAWFRDTWILNAAITDGISVFAGDTTAHLMSSLTPSAFLSTDGVHPANATQNTMLGQWWAVSFLQRFGSNIARWTHFGGGNPAVATAYNITLSAASGVVGTAVTMVFSPTGGTWPAGVVITPTTTLTGTFSPTSVAPSGGAQASITFTPTAAATGSLNSSASPAMTNTSGAQTYTATAAATVATAYTAAQSASTGAVGVQYTITYTPTGGSWPASTTITLTSTGTGAATFSATSLTPTGSTPAVVTITPSAAGTVIVTSAAAGLTSTSGAQTFTASAAAGGARILDGITPAPSMVLANKRLLTSYSGSAMIVRRSSDNTTSTVAFLGTDKLDTASLMTFAGSGSANITSWSDQSGGTAATQTSVANQPVAVNAGSLQVNDRNAPCAGFYQHSFLRPTITGAVTVFAVVSRSGPTREVSEVLSSVGGFEFNLRNSYGLAADINKPRVGGPASGVVTWINGVKQVGVNPMDVSIADGVSSTFAFTATAVGGSGNLTIGSISDNSQTLSGTIWALIIFPAVLSDAQVVSVSNALTAAAVP